MDVCECEQPNSKFTYINVHVYIVNSLSMYVFHKIITYSTCICCKIYSQNKLVHKSVCTGSV